MPRKHSQRSNARTTKKSLPRGMWRPTPYQTSRPVDSHINETEFKHGSADDDGSETDDSLFGWDEEATLLSDLLEEEPPQTEDQQYDVLVESLRDPFLSESRSMKKEIASTLVSASNAVKAVYKALDQHVDPVYGHGLVQFNRACTDIESTMSIDHTKFQTTYQATKEKIDILFERLRKEYAVRDQLWVDVRKAVDEIVMPAIEQLKDVPASLDRTVVKLEKKSDSLEKPKDNNDISSLAKELWKKMV